MKDSIKEPLLLSPKKQRAAELRVGSDSDFPRLKEFFDVADKQNLNTFNRVLSAHRTPKRVITVAEGFPEVGGINPNIKNERVKNLEIVLSIASAGGAAHLAGETAAATSIPVIALPVKSSVFGTYNSTLSMLDMPRGAPNGYIADQALAVQFAKKIIALTPEQVQKIYIPGNLQTTLHSVIKDFGIDVTDVIEEATIGIHTVDITSSSIDYDTNKLSSLPIIIPKIKETPGAAEVGFVIQNIEKIQGLSMGGQLSENITQQARVENALLYCLQIAGTVDVSMREKFEEYRSRSSSNVVKIDDELVQKQCYEEKFTPVYTEIELPERYIKFHSGKVRETFNHPDHEDQLIIVATDRISTHDVVHNAGVPKKGETLTQVSNYRFDYLSNHENTKGIPTQIVINENVPSSIPMGVAMRKLLPIDFPREYRNQAIVVKKLSPLPTEAIVRGRLYGSVLDGYNQKTGKLDTGKFVGRELMKGSEFDEPMFTPSTKGKNDVNINIAQMSEGITTWLKEKHPQRVDRADEYIEKIEQYSLQIFKTAADHADSKGLIIADTKFEFALDHEGTLTVIDELLTSDSSRYRTAEGYTPGEEPEAFDKQPTRDYVMSVWGKDLPKVERHPVTILPSVIRATTSRYKKLAEKFQ